MTNSSEFIPVSEPLITPEDLLAVQHALKDGWISGEGPIVSTFEEKMATICNRKYGIAVSNGSVALDLLFEAMDFSPGDEVILPSFTIISCLNQLLRLGVKPVFVDADPVTWNMDVSQVEALITPKTRAILATHIYGLPVDMKPLMEIAQKHGVDVLEDAAEAHGLLYKNQICGSFGLASTFSFYANKNITTGEGGMILTDSPELASKLRTLRNLSFNPEKRFVHEELGWNSRLGAMQCALGISQLDRLSSIIGRRQEIAAMYREGLKGLDHLHLPAEKTDYADNHYWVFGVTLNEESQFTMPQLRKLLEDKGIGTRPFFYPLHRQPVLSKYGISPEASPLPVSEYLGRSGFYIPNGLGISNEAIKRVIAAISNVLN